MNDKLKSELMKKFLPVQGQRDEFLSSTIGDKEGYIMIWYLPRILNGYQWVCLAVYLGAGGTDVIQ